MQIQYTTLGNIDNHLLISKYVAGSVNSLFTVAYISF